MSLIKTAPWTCRSCGTKFLTAHDECVSCGARKLYDSELRGAWAENERLRALVGEMRSELVRFVVLFDRYQGLKWRNARAAIAKADEVLK